MKPSDKTAGVPMACQPSGIGRVFRSDRTSLELPYTLAEKSAYSRLVAMMFPKVVSVFLIKVAESSAALKIGFDGVVVIAASPFSLPGNQAFGIVFGGVAPIVSGQVK